MAALGFFRKNTKLVIWIMVGLMGVFLLGAVGSRQLARLFAPSPAEQAVGFAKGEEVTAGELDQAEKDLSICRRMGLGEPAQVFTRGFAPGEDGYMRFLLMAGDSERQRRLGWALLVREARSMGFEAGEKAVDRFVLEGLRMDDAAFKVRLASFRKSGVLADRVRLALSNYLCVALAFEGASQGAVPSEQVLRRMFKDTQAKMDVAMLRFNAADYLKDVPAQPAGDDWEDQLRKMWDELKTFAPGDPRSPHRLKFGYRQPERIRLEYAYIDWDDVADTIEPSNDEIFDYWQEHPDEFAPAKTDAEGTTTAPAEAERSYSDDKPKVRRKVRQIQTGMKIKSLISRLGKQAVKLEADKAPDASPTALDEAAEAMADEILVRYRYSPRWLTMQDVATDPLLRRVYTDRRIPLWRMAFVLKEFLPEDQAHRAIAKVGKIYSRPMVVLRPGGGASDSPAGLLVWRVVAAKPAAVPAAFDAEMLARVKNDWRVNQAYEIAMTKAQEAKVRVTEVGMADVAKDMKTEVIEADGLSKRVLAPGYQPQPGEDPASMFQGYLTNPPYVSGPGVFGKPLSPRSPGAPAFLAAVFEMAPDAEMEAATTTAPAAAEGLKVIGLPESRAVVLVQRVKFSPAYEQDFLADDEAMRRSLLGVMTKNNWYTLARKWYNFDEIVVRTGFTDEKKE